MINSPNREMQKKKYKMRDIIDAMSAVLINRRFKEKVSNSLSISTRLIIYGITFIICTVSKDLKIALNLQEFSIGLNIK